MKIDLPLETWTDVFGFLRRSQLVAFSPHIHDRQFASVLQFFLHKCGQIKLGKLHIRTSRNGNGPIVVQNNREFPLAEGPIPSNVVNFKGILLTSQFDSSVRVFLHELQQNSLLENVNLIFVNSSEDLFAFLATFLPSIVTINSITLADRVLYQSAHSKWVNPMLKSARVLEAWNNLSNDWYCEWLYSPREDGQPRLLVLYGSHSIYPFIQHIEKDFSDSKRAISFFIRFTPINVGLGLELNNEETGEKLELKPIDKDEALISRHPIGANEEWIKEMSKKPNYEYRNMNFIMDS